MFKKLLTLFILVPAAELLLLIQIGRWMGFWPTALLVIGTGVVGSYLARREGLQTLQRIQAALGRGELPGNELMDGAILLVSGAFLLTPGILTDLAGLLGLLPFTRAYLRGYLQKRLKKAVASGQVQVFTMPGPFPEPHSSTIEDAEWEVVSPDPRS